MKDLHKVINNNFSDSLLSKTKFCTLGQSFIVKALRAYEINSRKFPRPFGLKNSRVKT